MERWQFWKWSAAAVTVFLAACVLLGFGASSRPSGLLDAFEAGWRRVWFDRWELSRTEAVVLGLGVLALARRTLLAWLVYRPGPVMVVDFVDGRSSVAAGAEFAALPRPHAPGDAPVQSAGPKVSAESLSVANDVRQSLTRVALYPPRADESRSSAQFLALMRSQGTRSGPLAWVGGLVMFARPTHAYRVTGMLQDRPPTGEPESSGDSVDELGRPLTCGLTVQTTVLPSGTSGVHTFWASSWSRAAELTANAIVAFVVPRSRAAKEQPWRSLRGTSLQPEMFAEHQRARRLVRQRRYDEALRSYEALLTWYPGNLDLKLEFADVQERLGLFLDALAVYSDVVQRTNLGDRGRATHGWKHRALVRPRALWEKRHLTDPLLARYRLASAMAATPKMSSQWLETRDVGAERQRERIDARLRIRMALLDWYATVFAEHEVLKHYDIGELMLVDEESANVRPFHVGEPSADSSGTREASPTREVADDPARLGRWYASRVVKNAATKAPLRMRAYDEGYRSLHLLVEIVFLVASRHELANLAAGYTWEKRMVRGTLTRRAFTLSQMIVEQRLRAAQNELAVHRGLTDEVVKKPAKEVRREVHSVLRARIGSRSRSWIDQYNAACVFASAYRALHWYDNLDPDNRNEHHDQDRLERQENLLATNAVYRIEEAMRFADLRFVAERKNWILSEDPDLDQLREHPLFHAFEVRQFTSLTRLPPRTPNVHRYEASRYSQTLVAAVSAEMASRWELRSRTRPGRVDALLLRQWLLQERLIWTRLRDFTGELRHVSTRLALLDAVNDTRPSGRPKLLVLYPSWTDTVRSEADEDSGDVDASESKHEQRLNVNLEKLHLVLWLRTPAATFVELHRALAVHRLPEPWSQKPGAFDALAPLDDGSKPVLHNTKAWLRYLDRVDAGEVARLNAETVTLLVDSRVAVWSGVRDWFQANDKGRNTLNMLSKMPPAPQGLVAAPSSRRP